MLAKSPSVAEGKQENERQAQLLQRSRFRRRSCMRTSPDRPEQTTEQPSLSQSSNKQSALASNHSPEQLSRTVRPIGALSLLVLGRNTAQYLVTTTHSYPGD